MSPYRNPPDGPTWFDRWVAAFWAWWDDPLGRKAARFRREALEAAARARREAQIVEAVALLEQIPNHYERERRTIQFEMMTGQSLPRPWAEKEMK